MKGRTGRTLETDLDLANIIKGISFCEMTIETMRIKLAENPNFNIFKSFKGIDRTTEGLISKDEMQAFLTTNRFAASERECEYVINLRAKQKGIMDFYSFAATILPNTRYELIDKALSNGTEKENAGNIYQKHFTSDVMITSFSEREVANILSTEVKFYRELELLKQKFANENSQSIYEIYQIVDYKSVGRIDFEVLYNFMKRHNIMYSKEEYIALLRRIAIDDDDKVDYQEFVNAILPQEPYSFPAFRMDFNKGNVYDYVLKKAEKYNLKIEKAENFPVGTLKEPLDNNKMSFRNIYDPFVLGRNNYFYDKGYMGQLKDYQIQFINPCQEKEPFMKEGRKGVSDHDYFMHDFYKHFYEKEKHEEFFNRYGKRYYYDDNLTKIKRQLQ